MNNHEFTRNSIEAAVRLVLLIILAYWCYTLVSPFIVILLWAIIIAVAVFPLFLDVPGYPLGDVHREVVRIAGVQQPVTTVKG